jgi:hypothetical protein
MHLYKQKSQEIFTGSDDIKFRFYPPPLKENKIKFGLMPLFPQTLK